MMIFESLKSKNITSFGFHNILIYYMLSCPRCLVVKCGRHRGDDVCCSVVLGTLVGVFSVMWSELLMTSTISYPVWSSVYECQKVERAFTSPARTECGMFVMYCMQRQLFCSVWMCCLEEVYKCLQL